MDLICKVCGEPIEFAEFDDMYYPIKLEGYPKDGKIKPDLALRIFSKYGCGALGLSRECWEKYNKKARRGNSDLDMIFTMFGDDVDGLAIAMESYRKFCKGE